MKNQNNFILGLVVALGLLPQNLFAATYTYYQQPENDLYMLIGYPSTTVYNNLVGGSGPPQIGILGMLNNIAASAISAVKTAGITSCSSVPSTGTMPTGSVTLSFSSTSSKTVSWTGNYATASHTIPTGYSGAGSKYDKRIEISFADVSGSGHTSKIGMEFICGKDAGFVEMQIDGDTISNSYRTINMYIDSTDSTSIKVEFMMKVTSTTGTTGTVYDGQLVRLNINKTAATFTLNGINFFNRSSTYQGYRVAIVGTASGTASTYLTPSVFGASFSSVSGTTSDYTTVAATSAAFSTSFSWSGTTYQGCLNFTTQVDPSTTALCSGTSLSTPSAPLIDSTGGFNYTWLAGNINSKVTMSF